MGISSSSSASQSTIVRDSLRSQELDQVQRRARGTGSRRSGSDSAVISDEGQLLQKLSKAVQDSPDVREDKVAELRAAVAKGRYQVSYSEIAKAILASRTK